MGGIGSKVEMALFSPQNALTLKIVCCWVKTARISQCALIHSVVKDEKQQKESRCRSSLLGLLWLDYINAYVG